MVTQEYSHIWDCCCDHGLLGASLLSRQAAPNIHFVDIVPELISTLTNKLQKFYTNSYSQWSTHCLDVAKLPLQEYKGKHLVIISGVGGDLMMQFIKSINQENPHINIDFLLCPVHHQFALREELIKLNFSLKSEALLEDNRRFYEILLVSSLSDQYSKINIVGDAIWQSNTVKQAQVVKRYLAKTLSHYQRIRQSNNGNIDSIINAYKTNAQLRGLD